MRHPHLVTAAVFAFLALIVATGRARPADVPEYDGADLSEYFRTLMQPDHPTTSCCGEADAYYADEVDTIVGPEGEKYLVAIVTDTRPDEPRKRLHVPVGTSFIIPPSKIRKKPVPNPTDHTLLFLSQSGTVYCYEPVGGI